MGAKAIALKFSQDHQWTKASIARHFGIRPPSIHDWIKKGSISKDKLPQLWLFFSDVVGPEHWGLASFPEGLCPSTLPRATDLEALVGIARSLDDAKFGMLMQLARVLAASDAK